MLKKGILMSLLPLFILLSVATEKNGPDRDRAVFAARQKHWVDSVYNALTPDERIGQLFMVAAYSDANNAQVSGVEQLIAKYQVGGLIFFQGGPVRQAGLTNRYQSLARVPLLVGMDAEWGLGMRLDSTINFPRQMTLGAIQNNESIYRMGTEVARQCARLGVHLNFAPVVDINSNATCNANDGKSVIGFGDLPSSYTAYACTSTWIKDGAPDRVASSDIRLNKEDHAWTTRVRKSCSGRFDVESSVTHERGHTFGLGEAPENGHGNLTMSNDSNGPCQTSERSLGRGDAKGLNSKY